MLETDQHLMALIKDIHGFDSTGYVLIIVFDMDTNSYLFVENVYR